MPRRAVFCYCCHYWEVELFSHPHTHRITSASAEFIILLTHLLIPTHFALLYYCCIFVVCVFCQHNRLRLLLYSVIFNTFTAFPSLSARCTHIPQSLMRLWMPLPWKRSTSCFRDIMFIFSRTFSGNKVRRPQIFLSVMCMVGSLEFMCVCIYLRSIAPTPLPRHCQPSCSSTALYSFNSWRVGSHWLSGFPATQLPCWLALGYADTVALYSMLSYGRRSHGWQSGWLVGLLDRRFVGLAAVWSDAWLLGIVICVSAGMQEDTQAAKKSDTTVYSHRNITWGMLMCL